MTKKIDEVQFIKDFYGGKNYIEIADRHKVTIGTVAHRIRKLGLKRSGLKSQKRESFSAEEVSIMRIMLDTHGGRSQLLAILRGK